MLECISLQVHSALMMLFVGEFIYDLPQCRCCDTLMHESIAIDMRSYFNTTNPIYVYHIPTLTRALQTKINTLIGAY
jgi:hypothetical protein